VNSPNFDFSRFSPNIKKTPGEFMKLSPGFHPVFKYHQVFITKKNLVNSPGFHQVYKSHQVFTKIYKKLGEFIYKKLGEFIKLSPGFHQVLKFHQVFTTKKTG